MKLEPATDAAQTIARYRAHVSEGMAMLAELMEAHVEVRSEGTRIWDEEGTEYLDCGGYGVFILGHRYPRVVAAVRAQLDRHPMSSRVLLNGELAHAAEQLARVAPAGPRIRLLHELRRGGNRARDQARARQRSRAG